MGPGILRLMDKILHDLKDPKLWELWYIPYYGSCRILSMSRSTIGAILIRTRCWNVGGLDFFETVRFRDGACYQYLLISQWLYIQNLL